MFFGECHETSPELGFERASGLFWLVINAAMIELASAVVPGFHVDTFGAAFVGAIVLALVNMFFRWLAGTGRNRN